MGVINGYSFFGNDAHLNEEALALYVDALELNKVYLLPDAVLLHVKECAECKSDIIEVLAFVDEQEYCPKEAHPYLAGKTGFLVKRVTKSYRIAAVILVGIGLGIFFYIFRWSDDNRGVVNVQPESVQVANQQSQKSQAIGQRQVIQQNILADNFSESANLEDLVNSTSRSASFIVISPKNGVVMNQRITFEWKAQEVKSVTVKILSNKESLLRSFKLGGSKLLLAGKFNPGLYYWKVESKDELLYVGKFFVK
ncbi:MAG: hypothetical protein WBZ48_09135 [Bacteroidota bacterium]